MHTSATLRSSTAIRVKYLAGRVHALGPRPLYEYLCEIIGGSSDPMGRLEKFAAMDPEVLDYFGGRELPPPLRLVPK
jgi:hypothetical protein